MAKNDNRTSREYSGWFFMFQFWIFMIMTILILGSIIFTGGIDDDLSGVYQVLFAFLSLTFIIFLFVGGKPNKLKWAGYDEKSKEIIISKKDQLFF